MFEWGLEGLGGLEGLEGTGNGEWEKVNVRMFECLN